MFLGVCALVTLGATAFSGCTPRGVPGAAGDASPDTAPFATARAGPSVQWGDASQPLIDGARDYRGTLGTNTAIALHLVRAGAEVTGSYVYVAIGRPIRLDGSADANGALALTETADGKVTGTFRLRPQADGLAGEWADPAGKKALPVRLATGAAFPFRNDDAGAAAYDDAGTASSDSKRAEECLAHPTCTATDAANLFVTAAGANDPDLDCFRFLDGAGTSRDLALGRACLERSAKTMACGGSSMSLETAVLATLRIDGIGGRSDVAGARTLVNDCFDDSTRDALLEHAAAKEADPKTPPVDFCKDIGGTTITMNECGARTRENADTARALRAKTVFAGLDDEGKALLSAADSAYGDYVTAMGAFVYEVYVDGAIRGAMSIGAETTLTEARMKDLEAFPRFVARNTSAKDLAAARRATATALARVDTGTLAEKTAFAKTQRTWEAYRDADVALYEHVFGPRQGAERVTAARGVVLEARRAKECAPPSAGGQ